MVTMLVLLHVPSAVLASQRNLGREMQSMGDSAVAAAAPSDGTIVLEGLTKHFGSVVAVDDVSCTIHPGRVTGFLGPNGAGKTTTLRVLLGLLRPTAGRATIGGRTYAELDQPLRVVGAGLDGSSFHPGRSGRDHLRWVAATHGIDVARID